MDQDVIFHSVGFNLQRFEGVLKYGILSTNYASSLNVDYCKNYLREDKNFDYISCVRLSDDSYTNESSAYQRYTKIGINFIISGINYEDNKEKYDIHRVDEVLVYKQITKENIIGIMINDEIKDVLMRDLPVIPLNITKYNYIEDITFNYIDYLKKYKVEVDREEIYDYLRELLLVNKALYKCDSEIDRIELTNDYHEVLEELNRYLGLKTEEAFNRYVEKPTVYNIVKQIVGEQLPIYNLPDQDFEIKKI